MESFEKNVADAMDGFLQMDLTKDFFNAYRAQKIKRLHVRPPFLVRRKTDILQPDVYSDWQAITDYDCYGSEDDDGQNGNGEDDGDGGGDDGAADMTADASTESSNMEVDDGDTATNRVTPSMGMFAS